MKYKALESFAGAVCGHPGEILTIKDEKIAKDLLAVGYIEPVKETTKTRSKGVAKNED